MIRLVKRSEFARFVIIGSLATGIDFLAYNIALQFFSYIICAYIGFAVSFLFNYWLSAKWTFRTKMTISNFVGMICVHAINLIGCRTILLYIIVDRFNINPRIGYIMVMGICLIISFILNRIVFHKLSK
ncbi:MAG: GtrA family protein [Muribaculaceae bacterium]|nr:GtrA family protein [Muribaculaceae bacterium]